jgi:hypothetical protein
LRETTVKFFGFYEKNGEREFKKLFEKVCLDNENKELWVKNLKRIYMSLCLLIERLKKKLLTGNYGDNQLEEPHDE